MSDTPSSPVGDTPEAPSDLAEQLDALAWVVEGHRAELVRLARRWMRRLGVDEIGLAPEGAISLAWLTFQKRVEAGRIALPLGREEFLWRFRHRVRRTVQDHRRGQDAAKRGRARTVHLSGLARDGFDAIDGRSLRPEDQVIGAEQARYLLDLLAREGEGLVRIALLKGEGLTNGQIGRRIDRSLPTVKRELARIRTVLEPSVRGFSFEA